MVGRFNGCISASDCYGLAIGLGVSNHQGQHSRFSARIRLEADRRLRLHCQVGGFLGRNLNSCAADRNVDDSGGMPLCADLHLAAPAYPDTARRGPFPALRNDPQGTAGKDEIEQVPAANNHRDVGCERFEIDPVSGEDDTERQARQR